MIKIQKLDIVYRRDVEFTDLSFWDCAKITTKQSPWIWYESFLQRYCLFLVMEGSISFQINKRHTVTANDHSVVLLSPHTVVAAQTEAATNTFWILSFDCDDFMFFDFLSGYTHTNISSHVISLFHQLNIDINHQRKSQYYYEALLIIILEEIRHNQNFKPDKKKIYDDVCIYIRNHIGERLTVETVSQAMNYNKDYLSRILRTYNGSNIQKLIIEERMGVAKNFLLLTNYSCEKIANQIGFTSANSFIKFFKYHTGDTPSSYRRKNTILGTNRLHGL